MVLSDLVNEDSKILEVRDPRDRVQKVAPWLDARRRPLPGRGRRQGALDRRRLHDDGAVPVRASDVLR